VLSHLIVNAVPGASNNLKTLFVKCFEGEVNASSVKLEEMEKVETDPLTNNASYQLSVPLKFKTIVLKFKESWNPQPEVGITVGKIMFVGVKNGNPAEVSKMVFKDDLVNAFNPDFVIVNHLYSKVF